jgi:tetratricopeptide (TPR) repeat protein
MDFTALSKKCLSWLQGYLNEKIVRQILIVSLVVGVGVGGYYANEYFTNKKQRSAVVAFDEAMQAYYTALSAEMDFSGQSDKPNWSDVELAFETAYQQNDSSSLSPMFLVYQAQALAAAGKYDDAADMVGRAIDKMPECSSFYYLYKTMQASIMIDGGNSAGVDKLIALADNPKNNYLNMSKYYLAQYYLSKDKNDDARKIFKELAAKAGSDSAKGSWAELAKAYV